MTVPDRQIWRVSYGTFRTREQGRGRRMAGRAARQGTVTRSCGSYRPLSMPWASLR